MWGAPQRCMLARCIQAQSRTVWLPMKHLLASVVQSVPHTLCTCKLDRCESAVVLYELTQYQEVQPSAVEAQRRQSV